MLTALPRNLQATRRSPAYRRQLRQAWRSLNKFAAFSGRPRPIVLLKDPHAVQTLLIDYIQNLYDRQDNLSLGRYAILAVQYVGRHLRGQLRGAWDSIESWAAETESLLRPPFPLFVFTAIVGALRILGLTVFQKGEFTWGYELLALATLLESGFYGILRPIEMLGIGNDTTALPGSPSVVGAHALVVVEKPKNARQMGKRQFAIIRNPNTSLWLKWLLGDQLPSAKLWPYSASRARSGSNGFVLV